MAKIAYNGMGRRSSPNANPRHNGESYKKVTVTFIRLKGTSLLISKNGTDHWIPRALIFGPDDLKMETFTEYDTITIGLMQWKAKELGL